MDKYIQDHADYLEMKFKFEAQKKRADELQERNEDLQGDFDRMYANFNAMAELLEYWKLQTEILREQQK